MLQLFLFFLFFSACTPQTIPNQAASEQKIVSQEVTDPSKNLVSQINEGEASGTSVSIPAGTLALGTSVELKPTEPPLEFQVLNLPKASSSVNISATDVNGSKINTVSTPMTIALPIQASTNLLLQSANVCALLKHRSGLFFWANAQLQKANDKVTFKSTHLGVFRLVYCDGQDFPNFKNAVLEGLAGKEAKEEELAKASPPPTSTNPENSEQTQTPATSAQPTTQDLPLSFKGISQVSQTKEGKMTISWHRPESFQGFSGFKVFDVSNRITWQLLSDCKCVNDGCMDQLTSCEVNVESFRTYTFYVEAYSANGQKSTYLPLEGSYIIEKRSSDQTPPSAPTNISFSHVNGVRKITWTASTDNQKDIGAKIQYKLKRNGADIELYEQLFYDESNLTQGLEYTYQVCAYDASMNESCSATINKIYDDLTAPTITNFLKTNSSLLKKWHLSFDIEDNMSALDSLTIEVYRTVSNQAQSDVPFISTNLYKSLNMNNLPCTFNVSENKTSCVISDDGGPLGVSKFLNYKAIVKDAAGNVATNQVLNIYWDDLVEVYSVHPTLGALEGGRLIVVTGRNFTPASLVTVGGVACQRTDFISENEVYCITPASSTESSRQIVVGHSELQKSSSLVFYAYNISDGPTCQKPATWTSGLGFAKGAGTLADPYIICNANHLQNIVNKSNGTYYRIEDHIDLKNVTMNPMAVTSVHLEGLLKSGSTTEPEYLIAFLNINSSLANVGMFANLTASSTFKNLKFVKPTLNATHASSNLGVLFGTITSTLNVMNIQMKFASLSGQMRVGGVGGYISSTGAVYLNQINVEQSEVFANGNSGGLFGQVYILSSTGSVSNLKFSGSVINTSSYSSGGIIGLLDTTLNVSQLSAENTTIESLSGNGIGGVIGVFSNSACSTSQVFEYLSFSGHVKGSTYVGGVVGQMQCNMNYPLLAYSKSNGIVNGANVVGGIGGYIVRVNLKALTSNATVSSTSMTVGGLIGKFFSANSMAYFEDSYYQGAISGVNQVGGLIGFHQFDASQNASIKRSYFSGTLAGSGSNLGPIFGASNGSVTGLYSNVFWNKDLYNATSTVGIGLTSEQMKDKNNFTSFDFTSGTPIWKVVTDDLPKLSWEP